MQIQEMKLETIRPYPNNPRRNDEAVQAVAASIREFGWKQPIVVDRDGVIIVGHTRYKAAKELGLETVPVLVAEDLTEEQARAYRLADNKTNELSTWDLDMLGEEISALEFSDIDLSLLGFEAEDAGGGSQEISTESSYSYHEQYAVTVICKDEEDQQRVYERLSGDGYTCKVVCV